MIDIQTHTYICMYYMLCLCVMMYVHTCYFSFFTLYCFRTKRPRNFSWVILSNEGLLSSGLCILMMVLCLLQRSFAVNTSKFSTTHYDSKPKTHVLTLKFRKYEKTDLPSISEAANTVRLKHPIHETYQEGAQKRHKLARLLLKLCQQWLLWRGLGYIFSVRPFPHQSQGRHSAVQLLCAGEVSSRRFSPQFFFP